MSRILLLDNTLRDGGYVNDWNFGFNTIINIVNGLSNANVDIIEIGLINSSKSANLDKTIQPSTKDFDELLKYCNKNNSQYVAMIKYGTCSLDNISDKEKTLLDGIRVYFKKNDIKNAIEY